jgi:hypothetical protein
MPQNDNNSKAVSQLALNGRHKAGQNEPCISATLAPQDFQSKIV